MANADYSNLPALATRLPTLSATARMRAEVLRRLAADLDAHDDEDLHGDARMAAVVDVLFNGTEAQVSGDDLRCLLRLDVPRAIVFGGIREAR